MNGMTAEFFLPNFGILDAVMRSLRALVLIHRVLARGRGRFSAIATGVAGTHASRQRAVVSVRGHRPDSLDAAARDLLERKRRDYPSETIMLNFADP